jgi:hypothetical protein
MLRISQVNMRMRVGRVWNPYVGVDCALPQNEFLMVIPS